MDSDGFSFFVLAGQEAKPGVDARGNPLRKRAQHRKSRNGCGNCRRKKIKVGNFHQFCHRKRDFDVCCAVCVPLNRVA
jgi:hypothetical protein